MDLVNMAVVVISYTIHDIKVIHYESLWYFQVFALKVCINECKIYLVFIPLQDEVGYLTSLGMARTNEVMRDARIGEAEAQMATRVCKILHMVFHIPSTKLILSSCISFLCK